MKPTYYLRMFLRTVIVITVLETVCGYSMPGDLYVSDSAGTIFKFSPDGSKVTFVSGLDHPSGVAFDRAGNLFVSESASGAILKFDSTGSSSVFASGLANPMGLAFDGAGTLFAADSVCGSDTGCGSIFKFAPDGTKSTFVANTYNIVNLAFDLSGNLFGTIGGVAFPGGVVKFGSDGQGALISLSGGPGIAFNTSGSFFVPSPPSNTILKFTGNEMTVFASGLNNPYGLAFDGAGNLFETDFGSGEVIKVAPDGTKTPFASGLTQPTYLTLEPVTEKLRNISARGLVGTGDDVLIGGFFVGGNALANNAVVVRAIGPSLAQAGVSGPLADPTLELHDASGAIIASNDDWQETQKDQITAAGLAPADPKESAIYSTLAAGSYTAVVRGAGNTTGTAVVEIYSLTP